MRRASLAWGPSFQVAAVLTVGLLVLPVAGALVGAFVDEGEERRMTTLARPAWSVEPGPFVAPETVHLDTLAGDGPGLLDGFDLDGLNKELSGDCEVHPGIQITEDVGPQGFEWDHPLTGAQEPRPGSGVRGGSGTEDDPYVIDGWCVAATGITISGTSSHVIVKGNTMQGSGVYADDVGIRVEDAFHVRIEENHVKGFGYGIGVWRTDDVEISRNLLEENQRYGAWVAQSTRVVMEGNEASTNENGLGVGLSDGALIIANTIKGNRIAAFVNAFSDSAVFTGNEVARNGQGVYVREAFDVIVKDNRFQDHPGNAVAFDQSPRGLVEDNVAERSGHEGIIFWASPFGVAAGNTVTQAGFADDRYAIRMAGSTDGTVTGNTMAGNAHGLVVDGSPDVIVKGNLMRDNEGSGAILWESPGVELTLNTITANGIGIQVVEDSQGTGVTKNNIYGNLQGFGLDAKLAGSPVEADGNWWGCLQGPDHEDCDDVVGDAEADPWARTPVREAPEAPHPGPIL